MDIKDVKVDTFRGGDVFIRLTHLPTGQTVSGQTSGDVCKKRNELLDILRNKLTHCTMPACMYLLVRESIHRVINKYVEGRGFCCECGAINGFPQTLEDEIYNSVTEDMIANTIYWKKTKRTILH